MANPLNNFNFKNGVDILSQKLKSPFDRYKSAEKIKQDLKGAHERNDFKNGFVITPYSKNGNPLTNDVVALLADAMPIQPFVFGGQQKIVKDYYPGNSEPTVQVIGPQENDITINGRIKSKRIKVGAGDNKEDLRLYPQYVQESIEAIRVAGLLVRLNLGSWQRYGFIQDATFNMKNLSDIEYKINFIIVGFNQPKDYIVRDANKQAIPYNKNKETAKKMAELLNSTFGKAPDSMPKSFADQINSAISDVAAAVNLVTGFVDTVLGEVDSVKASVQRALGLIKNARNQCTTFQRRIGSLIPSGGVDQATRINGGYANSAFIASSLSGVAAIVALLAGLVPQLKAITQTIPLGRHRVASGDTLQKIAMKYYKDASKWEDIYDHNNLSDTALVVGSILEIPRA
jgi:nucleoid-associated protein YgaU